MELTYPDVGATRDGPATLPVGYRYVARRVLIGSGEAAFVAAAAALRDWSMFRRARLEVRASAPEAAPGVDVTLGLGAGPLRLRAPCRIVWLVDEPRRYGYGLGTLPGHPASGEEAVEVTLDERDAVWAEVRAFSRPARWYSKAGGPITRTLQHRVTARYLRSLRHPAATPGALP